MTEPLNSLHVGTTVKHLIFAGLLLGACGLSPRFHARTPLDSETCSLGGAARANAAISALGRGIASLAPFDDPGSAGAALGTALRLRCLWRAQENPRVPRFGDASQAGTWWRRGGRAWLISSLERSDSVVLPPDVLPVLARSRLASAAVQALVCEANEATCGRETLGWSVRAEQIWQRSGTAPLVASRQCRTEAQGAAPDHRYRVWRTCLEANRPRRPALPLGRLRAPTTGWLLLRRHSSVGRETCAEVLAFDLETGSGHLLRRCRPRSGGPTRDTVVAGRVPVEALREAAWMTFLAPQVVSAIQTDSVRYPVPAAVHPHPGVRLGPIVELGGDTLAIEGYDPMTWWWEAPGRVRAVGSISWPHSARAGEDYADDLWRVVEASVQQGCVLDRLPVDLTIPDAEADRALDLMRAHEPRVCGSSH